MILLHSAKTGKEVYFNPQHIVGCTKLPDGRTSIQLSTEDWQDVKESPETVALIIRGHHVDIAVEINHRINH